jgi:hypothetical protein
MAPLEMAGPSSLLSLLPDAAEDWDALEEEDWEMGTVMTWVTVLPAASTVRAVVLYDQHKEMYGTGMEQGSSRADLLGHGRAGGGR